MVEMALVTTLFFGLVFAIIEFALAIFYANRLVDATRAGARFAVVSTPLLENLTEYECASLPGYAACADNVACNALAVAMSGTIKIPVNNISYRYQCTQLSNEISTRVYSVSIKVTGMKYVPIFPNLIVMGHPDAVSGATFEINMPEFETTRTSEDLFGN